jgi:hypothetical protein
VEVAKAAEAAEKDILEIIRFFGKIWLFFGKIGILAYKDFFFSFFGKFWIFGKILDF